MLAGRFWSETRNKERGIAGLCKRFVTKLQPKSARPFPEGKGRLAFERLLRCSSLTDQPVCSFVAPRIHLKSKPPTILLFMRRSIIAVFCSFVLSRLRVKFRCIPNLRNNHKEHKVFLQSRRELSVDQLCEFRV